MILMFLIHTHVRTRGTGDVYSCCGLWWGVRKGGERGGYVQGVVVENEAMAT